MSCRASRPTPAAGGAAAAPRAAPAGCIRGGGTSSGVRSRSPIAAASAATRSCDIGMVPQRPQRVGQRRCGRVVAGQYEDQQVVGDVAVGQRPAGVWVGGRDQRLDQRCIAGRIRAARLQDVHGDLTHRRHRGAGAAARRSRQPSRRTDRPQCAVGGVGGRDVHVLGDHVRGSLSRYPERSGPATAWSAGGTRCRDRRHRLRATRSANICAAPDICPPNLRTFSLVNTGCSARLRGPHVSLGSTNRLSPANCRTSS